MLQIALSGVGGQTVGDGPDTRLGAGPFLVAHVNLRGRIIAHQQHGQAGRAPGFGRQGRDFLFEGRAQSRGRSLTVQKQHRSPFLWFAG